MTSRASVISSANTAVGDAVDQHAEEMPQRRRPAHRQRGQVDARADGGAGREGDAGAGQHQAELQIEPGRGDLGADRARGGLQAIEDVVQVHVHRRNLDGLRQDS